MPFYMYVLVALVLVAPFYALIYRLHGTENGWSATDRVFCTCLAIVLAAVWPFALAGLAIIWFIYRPLQPALKAFERFITKE